MIEVFTMALHQSNIIINILLVSAFFIKFSFCIHYYFHGGVQQILYGRGYWF